MGEISVQSGSSLSIVEKKPQRPGGCVGIFFQLFDWNRKFAKKNLFPKKLLPPVRLRKASKKFGGDEKMPKLRLIADENSGSFPHVKKNNGACNNIDAEQKTEMRAPGLVARLMGLESMPAVQHDRLKEDSLSGARSNKGEKIFDGRGRFEGEELNVEKGEIKQELRPQKLQKTGLSERRPVTRFGAEALQVKNVLSRSRKHHQKLVSPVKSPRTVSGKNASRLIGAATRILEPGLERSRTKCALTYLNVVHHPPAEALMEKASDLEPLEKSNYFQNSAKPLNVQSSSCRNCGYVVDVADVRPNTEGQPPVFSPMSQFENFSCQVFSPVSEKDNRRLPIFCPELEKGKSEEDSQLHAAFAMDDRQPCAYCMPDRKLLNRAGQIATSLQCKIVKDVSPVCLRHKSRGQNQMFQARDRLPSRSKLSRLQSNRVSSVANATDDTKNCVLMNQNLGDHPRLRMPAKEDSYLLDTDQKNEHRRHDSLPPVRKRRSVNSSRQNEGPTFVSSFAIYGKDRGYTSQSTIGPCSNKRLADLQESIAADSGKNDSDVISFTFKSPMKRKTGFHADVEGRTQNVPNGEVTPKFNENDGKKRSPKSFPLSGDSLGALLEQKLKELTCQEEEDSAFGDTTPKKTTAMILQELISALTTEVPGYRDDLAYGGQQSKKNSPTTCQAKPKSTKKCVAYLPNCEHLSPGSVLEASFSNDSSASSSLDDASRCDLGESTECCEGQHPLEADANHSDSANSLILGKFCRDSITNLLNNISEVFRTINLADVHLKGSKLTHAKEVILNAELVFGNAAMPDAIVNGGFSISHFVLNELKMLASVMLTNFGGFVVFNTKEGGNQLKGFVFDCVIEYLDSRFSRYSNSGFNAWTRLPLRMKTEMLICEIVEEVGRWAEFAGLIPDELIEHEMSHALGKWTDFELEGFETGIEIDQQILQTLITEIVVDLTGCMEECC
ncbi:hypothetical protein ACH5RR_011694 [Cinchona calisaya]|uniref:DUF4378 domain-containing protein n=1 Tax=Cinchona calisaya TaxID=153742 RepID=A0ABD3A684_9GENT